MLQVITYHLADSLPRIGAARIEGELHLLPANARDRSQKAIGAEAQPVGSGRGDGIAPVTPPTPPDMRFSASGG